MDLSANREEPAKREDLKELETILSSVQGIDSVRIINKLHEGNTPIDISSLSVINWSSSAKNQAYDIVKVNPEIEECESNKKPHAFVDGGHLQDSHEDASTLPELLIRASQVSTDKGIIYLLSDGKEYFQSYPELLRDAKRLLAGLKKKGLKPLDYVLFQFNDNRNFILALWACLFGGFLPTPIATSLAYAEETASVKKLCHTWNLLNKPIILTDQDLLPSLCNIGLHIEDSNNLRIEAVENLLDNEPDEDLYLCSPQDLAINLLTSGSTGMPKCIQHRHRSILSAVKGMVQFHGFSNDEVTLNWMPLDHVGGLIMFHLRDVYLGCMQVNARINAFIDNPLNWLDWIDRYRASATWSANFAFSLLNDCKEQIEKSERKWDLSCMKSLVNGGEAVVAKTAQKFLSLLESFGLDKNVMQPAYGMAEISSGVIYSSLEKDSSKGINIVDSNSLANDLQYVTVNNPNSILFTEVGIPVPGVKIRIVDQENQLLSEDRIGRLQVSGQTLMSGYYNAQESNEEVFTEDSWFNTGDLGFIHDGRLTITGREKELIVINGANYLNYDIEHLVEDVPGVVVTFVAACGIFSPERGNDVLAIFFVPSTDDFTEIKECLAQIRRNLSRKMGLNADFIIPINKEDFPKTNSGKIQRAKLCEDLVARKYNDILRRIQSFSEYYVYFTSNIDQYQVDRLKQVALDKGMQVTHNWYFIQLSEMPINQNNEIDDEVLLSFTSDMQGHKEPTTDTEKKLCRIWGNVLGKQIGLQDNFLDLGADSLSMMRLIAEIVKEFDVEIPIDFVFQNPSIEIISEYLQSHCSEGTYSPIPRAKSIGFYPLSSAQARVFFLFEMEKEAITFNTTIIVSLDGKVDNVKVQNVFQALLDRHESLRTGFGFAGGAPAQIIVDIDDFAIETFTATEDSLTNVVGRFVKPFDLHRPPLIRVAHVELPLRDAIVLDIHHIIADGVSISILLKEFAQLYNGGTLTPSKIQYKDYSVWHRDMLGTSRSVVQEHFWLDRFRGEIPILNLPYDYPRPAIQNFEGDNVGFVITKEVTEALGNLARQENVTLFMLLLACFNVFLYKYTGEEDIIIGIPIADRVHPDLQEMIGMFQNTIPMRNHLSGEKLFLDFLEEVKMSALEAYQNQDVQFEDLLKKLNMASDLGRNPIFDVSFSLQNMDLSGFELETVHALPFEHKNKISRVGLGLEAVVREDELICNFGYSTKLFKRGTVEKFTNHLSHLLTQVAVNPNRPIAEISVLSNQEKKFLVHGLNQTSTAYSDEKIINRMFEEQVSNNPNNIALRYRYSSDDQHSFIHETTYRELNERANQMARTLIKRGLAPREFVAIMMERRPEMIEAVLAVLKAGGAYVPIEPNLPQARVLKMLSTLKVRFVIASGKVIAQRSDSLIAVTDLKCVLNVEKNAVDPIISANRSYEIATYEEISKASRDNVEPRVNSTDIAYVIFTSGSTGEPKGVVVCHRPVVNVVEWVNKTFNVNASDRLLFVTSLGFDLSVYDIFGTLAAGASIFLATDEQLREPNDIIDILLSEEITFWDSAPQALHQLIPFLADNSVRCRNAKLKRVFLSGDWIPVAMPDLLRSLFNDVTVVALGGATEATIWSNFYVVGPVDLEWPSIPYGKPIQNACYYVLDIDMNPCPIVVAGDLYIGGQCLSSGYINDSELTANRFLDNPFQETGKIYKTGDRARWLEDGNMEFLGRSDHQLKVRGFRVELGEIEHALLKHAAIKEAVVDAKKDRDNNNYLCAYYTLEAGVDDPGQAELRRLLANELPEYMIPAFFVHITAIPLTSNGKLDKKTLLNPPRRMEDGDLSLQTPNTKVQSIIAEIWKETLDLEEVSVKDNFFDIGGHSLLLIQVNHKLNEQLRNKVDVQEGFKYPTLVTMFQYPTISQLAAFISDQIDGMASKRKDDSSRIDESIKVMDEKLAIMNTISTSNRATDRQ